MFNSYRALPDNSIQVRRFFWGGGVYNDDKNRMFNNFSEKANISIEFSFSTHWLSVLSLYATFYIILKAIAFLRP